MFDTGAPWHAAYLRCSRPTWRWSCRRRPASIGVFEVAAQAALTAYGVPAALALSFALVLHAVNIIPYLSSGRVGIARRMGAHRGDEPADAGPGAGA